MSLGFAQLAVRALLEIAWHDLTISICGFNRIRTRLAKQRPARRHSKSATALQVCEAVNLAACFYFKRVLCLQKSVVTARLLRRSGIDASVVIGYRQAPFFSHAWVEVDSAVVNDSPAYKQQLVVLSVM